MSPATNLSDSGQVDTAFKSCLLAFQRRFNENPRAKRLVKGWNRELFLEPTDVDVPFTLSVIDDELAHVREGRPIGIHEDAVVHLQAERSTLIQIFSGAYNPSAALLDGVLAVFSNPRDKVKLEALAVVIWVLA